MNGVAAWNDDDAVHSLTPVPRLDATTRRRLAPVAASTPSRTGASIMEL
jgi:hypothetical protein